ncbi:ABC transporter permease [Tuanshanicoccus yangjingiae]|uniref:ABC transporter permease n=1 Tax=Aerococcaceae bacterium zg-252 TaxID=2796928 RepID=UPI004062964C
MIDIIVSSFTQGVVWSVMAIGVYITFRLLDIADLSAEGTFPLGAAICASLITSGVHPIVATLIAFVGGALAGLLAGWIHTKLHIPALITGILVLTGLYSINLHVMAGRPNIALLGQTTIFSIVQDATGWSKNVSVLVVTLVVLAVILALLISFLNTEVGLALRATGDNLAMSAANGINTNWMKTIGYMIGNGLIALAGAMVAQKDGFSDIGMGIGTIVIGLASVIVAEVVIPNKTIGIRLTTIILGSFIYRLIIDTILNQPFISIRSTDLRFFSAVLLTFVLYLPELQRQRLTKNRLTKGGRVA